MAEFSVERTGPGWYLVRDAERQWRVAVADGADTTWVFVEGHVGTIEADTRIRPKPGRGRGESGVMAPMPATVVALHAAVGQSVVQGDTLIVLEAMKMELPIRAPRDGVIRAVHCATGDLVQPGVNLLELE